MKNEREKEFQVEGEPAGPRVAELIRRRRSVRSFDGSALRPEDAEQILDFAKKAENPYGIPIEWRLLSAKADGLSSPVIIGTDAFIAGKMTKAPHAEAAFGYSFEQIVLCAEALGVGTTWIAGTMDRPAFERAMELRAGEVMPCVSPLGYPAAKMSLRETMMRKGIKADTRLPFSELFFDGTFDMPLAPERAGDLRLPLEMVRLAPSAVNKQPWRVVLDGDRAHFYEAKGKGFTDAEGWDIQKIDVGIAMCHFACTLEELGRTAEFELREPEITPPQNVVYVATCVMKT